MISKGKKYSGHFVKKLAYGEYESQISKPNPKPIRMRNNLNQPTTAAVLVDLGNVRLTHTMQGSNLFHCKLSESTYVRNCFYLFFFSFGHCIKQRFKNQLIF